MQSCKVFVSLHQTVEYKRFTEESIMARPIKETPILYGKDAERFVRQMENVKPASEEEKKQVRASYEKVKKWATFMM